MRQSKTILKASKTVATVYGTFFICWFPVSVYSLKIAFSEEQDSRAELKWLHIMLVEVLPLFNSLLNPFIYAIMNKQYRRAFKSIFARLNQHMLITFKYRL